MSEMRNFLPNPRPFSMTGWQSCSPAKLAGPRDAAANVPGPWEL